MAVKRRLGAEKVRIRVVAAFDGMRAGDEAELDRTDKVEGWIRSGYVVEVSDGGTRAARSGGSDTDDAGSEPAGAAGSE